MIANQFVKKRSFQEAAGKAISKSVFKKSYAWTCYRGVMTISTDDDKLYDTDLSDAAWALIAPMLPAARPGGRPRKINIRAVLNAIFYLLRTVFSAKFSLPRKKLPYPAVI